MSKINDFKSLGLAENVLEAIEILGYEAPLNVQTLVIPHILEGKDLIVQSQTGSGKTAAFGIPIINQLEDITDHPQVLILVPTRELAVQVSDEIKALGQIKKVKSMAMYGKQQVHVQLRQLKKGVAIVVGTPGRVGDMIRKKNLVVKDMKYLVIDEADELLRRGFLEEVEDIIKRLPSERNTLLFSATMPKEIEMVCSEHMFEPLRIEVVSKKEPLDQIQQSWYEVSEDWKYVLLSKLLKTKNPNSCMVFCNTRRKVDQLSERLQQGNIPNAPLHGGMVQRDRLRAIEAFKKGEIHCLIATDLAARGLHIDALDLVVNYNIPMDDENYVHRIGRTGRVEAIGEAISFVSVHDQLRWTEVQAFVGYKIEKAMDTLADNSQDKKSMKNEQRRQKVKTDSILDGERLRINAGKKKKIRPGDIVGALCAVKGIEMSDIGNIDIQDSCTYVLIKNKKGSIVESSQMNVKGKTVTVKIIR